MVVMRAENVGILVVDSSVDLAFAFGRVRRGEGWVQHQQQLSDSPLLLLLLSLVLLFD